MERGFNSNEEKMGIDLELSLNIPSSIDLELSLNIPGSNQTKVYDQRLESPLYSSKRQIQEVAESSSKKLYSSQRKLNDVTESPAKVSYSSKRQIDDVSQSSSNVLNSSKKRKLKDVAESPAEVSYNWKRQIDDVAQSSSKENIYMVGKVLYSSKRKLKDGADSPAKVSYSFKGKINDVSESSSKVLYSSKRKLKDVEESPTEVSYNSKRKIDNVTKLSSNILNDEQLSMTKWKMWQEINELSDYEYIILKHILSFKLDLDESNCNYLVAQALRIEQYHAYVCNTEWIVTDETTGKVYGGMHSFVEIKDPENNEEENLIIDLHFRRQFQIWAGTHQMIPFLPDLLVSSRKKLPRIIDLITLGADLHIKEFLLCKWLSPCRQLSPIQADHINILEHLRNYHSSMSLPIEERQRQLMHLINIINDMNNFEFEIMNIITNEAKHLIHYSQFTNQWVLKTLRGYKIPHAMRCCTLWSSFDAAQGLVHKLGYEYVCAQGRPKEKLIIDIDFQNQFTTIPDKMKYQDVWNYLPQIFVGTERRLRNIITIICDMIDEPIPLHLKPNFLYNKWLSPIYILKI